MLAGDSGGLIASQLENLFAVESPALAMISIQTETSVEANNICREHSDGSSESSDSSSQDNLHTQADPADADAVTGSVDLASLNH